MLNIVDINGVKLTDDGFTTSVPAGKSTYVWCRNLGRAAVEHLAAALAEKLVGSLFTCDERPCLLSGGTLSPLTIISLRELIDQHFVTPRLVARDDDQYDVVYSTISELSRQDLLDVLQALTLRAPAGISKPRVVSENLMRDIVARVRSGEPKAEVAAAYRLNIATVDSAIAAAA
jgi:hypothetical protein